MRRVISPLLNLNQFSTSLLPHSVEKRPLQLTNENEIEWHSKCDRLYIHTDHKFLLQNIVYFIGLFCKRGDILQKKLMRENECVTGRRVGGGGGGERPLYLKFSEIVCLCVCLSRSLACILSVCLSLRLAVPLSLHLSLPLSRFVDSIHTYTHTHTRNTYVHF